MKKVFLLMTLVLSLCLTSCGFHSPKIFNSNNSTTEVVLSKKNFKVVQTVQGTASDNFFFGFGGLKKALLAEAREKMLAQANLQGKSRALINERVEEHRSAILIFGQYTITVSAEVVEFTE